MSRPQRLLLVRHAESTNNDLYRRTGARTGRVADPLLSAHGEQQALAVGAALAAEALTSPVVWASPTGRAVQTAGALVRAGTGREVELHPDLVEGGGIYERDADDIRVACPGRPLDELRDLAGVELRWGASAFEHWGGGFEEHDAIPTRAGRLVDTVRGSGIPLLVAVTHEWFTQHVIRAALGLDLGNDAALRGWFSAPNASISEIHLGDDGTAELVRLGVTAHLAAHPSRATPRIV